MKWHEKITPPTEIQMKYIGSPDWDMFIKQSERLVPPLYETIAESLGVINEETKVLDFGCGVGRIAHKMWHDHRLPTHACDINEYAIEYLKSQIIGPEFLTTSFSPPLPYDAGSFDLIYSISIWTHLSPEMQIPWLKEIHRIIRPGGYALISVSSETSMPIRQQRLEAWKKYNEEDVKEHGILYVEYPNLIHAPKAFPGVEGSYGSTCVNLEYIEKLWGEFFSEVEIKPLAIGGNQDLVVLKK